MNATRCATVIGRQLGVGSMRRASGAVPLTGCTLQASLKMRCDNSKADYAIYWGNVNDKLVVAGCYSADVALAGYTKKSEEFALDAKGEGPVATTYNTQQSVFVGSVADSNLKRKEVAKSFGVRQVVFEPFERGVLEYGTASTLWTGVPAVPTMPKAAIRKGFENLGASYCMYWAKQGDNFVVKADYVTDARKKSLAATRADDKTFCSESKGVLIPADGNGPIATAFREGREVNVTDTSVMKRADLAKEFGVARVVFVPTDGGVLEFGCPDGVFLTGNALAASLKMRCDTSGAGYALYWKSDLASGKLAVSGSYVTPARAAVLEAQGHKESFAEASKNYTLDMAGSGPVATVMKTQEPFYIQDVQTCEIMKRGELTKRYGIQSICFVPVPGGVLEYGTSVGPCTANWEKIEDARKAIMPKEELQKAFGNGATHVIFWHQVGDVFQVGASYVIPERERALKQARGDDKSYTSESWAFKLPASGNGPVATAARSGVTVDFDAASELNYQRKALAKEFKVGKCYFVPCRDGVLEYGTGEE